MAVIILAVIWIAVHLIRRGGKRRRRRRAARPLLVRSVVSRPAVNEAQRERAERAAEKKVTADRKKAFQKKQAYDDIAHLQQMQRDILTVYNVDLAIINDATQGDRKRRAAFERNINRDCKIRSIQKKIEKAQYILTEP